MEKMQDDPEPTRVIIARGGSKARQATSVALPADVAIGYVSASHLQETA